MWFMAPERARGEAGGLTADLWSLGMLLYVLVEGRNPLQRSTPLATLAAVQTDSVPPPRAAGALSPALHALLARDPAARPDPATLDRMLAAAQPPSALRPGTPPRDATHQPRPDWLHQAPTEVASTAPPSGRPTPGAVPDTAPTTRARHHATRGRIAAATIAALSVVVGLALHAGHTPQGSRRTEGSSSSPASAPLQPQPSLPL